MVATFLDRLRIRYPIVQAPMGGGPGTPRLAAEVSNAGGLGSLAGAYLTPAGIAKEYEEARTLTDRPLNINLFAGGYHSHLDRDPSPVLALMDRIHAELQLPPPAVPAIGPDPFLRQIEAVLRARPEVFSFTFGIPPAEVLDELRAAGITIVGTATTVQEAELLAAAGVDAIVAQGAEAGAHRGTFAGAFDEALVPTIELVHQIAKATGIPVLASGGIMTGGDIARALEAGASGVQLGTAFLTCPEAGTSPAYRKALMNVRAEQTVITRAYSGRAARGIRNAFIDLVAEREELILPFPFQNSLTRPMRAAAAEAMKSEYLSLWAGTGVDRIRELPAAELIATLMAELRAMATSKSSESMDAAAQKCPR
jgi:nitronate monooxygenase